MATVRRTAPLALLTADVDAKTATLRQAAPKIDEFVQNAYPVPDGKRAAIRNSTGWYLAPLGAATKPQRLIAEIGTHPVEVQFRA